MYGYEEIYPFPEVDYEFWSEIGMMGASSIFGILLAVYMLIAFVSLVFSVASYVLYSLGLYTIANRRGIHNGWLAWLPVGDAWILGSISDQYRYVVKGEIRNRRKVMLWLYVALAAAYLLWFVFIIIGAVSQVDSVAAGAGFVAVLILGSLAFLALAIVLAVFRYIALYDLFASCNPNNATLFLVLSIVFQVALPFFVFACRKQDGGMPPRKQPVAPQAPEPLPEETFGEPEETATEEGFAQPEEFEENP